MNFYKDITRYIYDMERNGQELMSNICITPTLTGSAITRLCSVRKALLGTIVFVGVTNIEDAVRDLFNIKPCLYGCKHHNKKPEEGDIIDIAIDLYKSINSYKKSIVENIEEFIKVYKEKKIKNHTILLTFIYKTDFFSCNLEKKDNFLEITKNGELYGIEVLEEVIKEIK